MILFIIILFQIAFSDVSTQQKSTAVTPNVHDRVAALKIQIAKEIKENQRHSQSVLPLAGKDTFSDDYDYADVQSRPITPIMNFDERKKKNKFKLKEIVTTTKQTIDMEDRPVARTRPKRVRMKKNKRVLRKKPTDIFYRRGMDENAMDLSSDWSHCQTLITPFLEGYKCNMSDVKMTKVTDNVVLRLIQLIRLNTTEYTKEEVYSILYQISNLNLRFFQWDVLALKHLFIALSRDPEKHTFRSVKAGLKRLFVTWHLDIGNVTNLLKQARIFRPPCVRMKNDYGGSTMSSRNPFTGKPPKHHKKCDINDRSCYKS